MSSRSRRHTRHHRHSKDSTGIKPPRAEVAQLLGDPVVRGKPFLILNSVEKAHSAAGTGVISEATRPVCQAGWMWPLDQVLFLVSASLLSPLLFLLPLLNAPAHTCFGYHRLLALCLLVCSGICFQWKSICEMDRSPPECCSGATDELLRFQKLLHIFLSKIQVRP